MDKVLVHQKGYYGITLFWIVCIYLFIYNPPFSFIPISPIKIIDLLLIFIAFKNRIWTPLISFMKIEICICLFIICHCIFLFLFTSTLLFAFEYVSFIFECLIAPYIILTILHKQFKDKNKVIYFILCIPIIASFISCFLIINPETNNFVRESLLVTSNLTEKLTFRSFGISDSLIFSYAIAQGLGFCICLYYSNTKKLLYFFLPFLFISIMFNARTGFVPIIIYFLYILFTKKGFKQIAKVTIITTIIFVLAYNNGLLDEYKQTLEWAFDFIIEITSFMTNESLNKTGNTDILKTMIVLPENTWDWILGSGKNLFTAQNNSDIGYIIQLNYGGIYFITLIFCLVISLYLKLYVFQCKRWFILLFIGTILICNIKGYFILTNPGFRFLMLLYSFYINMTISTPQNLNQSSYVNHNL
ncbi:hypothetical protein DW789_03485 [Phocaeicola plebeius]|jgi:hypothetical protein|uniref:O-antigen ligase domain-containing protein n=1 Tax=Phocaeicola plebeius TaxID=310297 RepID=A0A414G0Y1_9BACT|nr:hypothetical protein DW789_03485 [Phocaeicola plebeius]